MNINNYSSEILKTLLMSFEIVFFNIHPFDIKKYDIK